MLALALLLTLGQAPDAGCPWTAPRVPPFVELSVFGGAEFKVETNLAWFRCAKKTGTLELIWSKGAGGELVPLKPVPLTYYVGSGSLPRKEVCDSPGLKQVQATLKGTGELARLDWSSDVVELYCEACLQHRTSGESEVLVMHTSALAPKGTWTLEASFAPAWLECAKKTGGELKLRLFTGATKEEVRAQKEPSFVVALPSTQRVKKQFPNAELCAGKPKFVGYELGGTGEFQALPRRGRAIQESDCR